MTNRNSDKIFISLTSALLTVGLIVSISFSALALDIPEKVCSNGAVKNNSVSLYIKGSVGQPMIQKCNSVSLYIRPGFIQSYMVLENAQCQPGDANNDNKYNILDAVYLIDYKYRDGPPPIPDEACSGDPTCDCETNIIDVVHLIGYIYKSGLPPCANSSWHRTCE